MQGSWVVFGSPPLLCMKCGWGRPCVLLEFIAMVALCMWKGSVCSRHPWVGKGTYEDLPFFLQNRLNTYCVLDTVLSMGITKCLWFSSCPQGTTSYGPIVCREFIAVLECPPPPLLWSRSYFIDFMDPILIWGRHTHFLRGPLTDLWWLILILPMPQKWVSPF